MNVNALDESRYSQLTEHNFNATYSSMLRLLPILNYMARCIFFQKLTVSPIIITKWAYLGYICDITHSIHLEDERYQRASQECHRMSETIEDVI